MAAKYFVEMADELPPNCPPDSAYPPNGKAFFRMAFQFPPTEEDFFSKRRQGGPNKNFLGVDECIVRSVSLYDNLDDMLNGRRLPRLKRKSFIVRIILPTNSGLISKTFRSKSHFSWWRSKGYNPVDDCDLVNEIPYESDKP